MKPYDWQRQASMINYIIIFFRGSIKIIVALVLGKLVDNATGCKSVRIHGAKLQYSYYVKH
jgi:hypothetical protein